MRIAVTTTLALAIAASAGAQAQTKRRPAARPGGSATLVVFVSDQTGAPIGNVKVTVTPLAAAPANGPREARTEGGRITFENVRPGNYRLRFDREGFVPLERELTARGGAPMNVEVTLSAAPTPPPPPPAPAAPSAPAPALNPDPMAIDMTTFIEKNYIGRAETKVSPLTCTAGGPALLVQVKEALAEPARTDADVFLYVIAGEGIGRAAGRDQPLHAGTFMMVPRGVALTLAAGGRTPLVVLSVLAGGKCEG